MFGEALRYASPQKPGTTARFDGNISEITYMSYNGTPAPSSDTYGYDYDGLKRLTDAAHYAGAATTQSLLKTEKNITYDRNGNITGLNRYGAAGLSEMLSFTHAGNRLSSVQSWDGANLPQIGTFTYDALGNQLTDSRKGLQFCYNLANLPSKVEGMAGSANAGLTLNYGYLSDGTKTSAITETAAGSGAEGLKYRGAFVYELKDGAERLSSVAWSDGRTEYDYSADASIPDISDQWHISDHLGNVRAVVLMDYSGGTVLEQNEYLPFGTRLDGTLALPENRYRLGGKEEQRFDGLDLALSDFGARFYDPFTARWTTRDPLAGKYHSLSPYNYCAGNPVNLVDPDGKDIWRMNNEGFIVRVEKSVEKFELQNQDSSQSITLRDDSMMEALSKGDNISSFVTDKTSLNIDEFLNVFVFASNSSSVEWSVHINEEEIAIGTHHSTDSGGTWSDFGLSSKPETSIHSHPGISQQYEVSSIGFELDGNGGARIWYPSDAYNMRHNADAFARHTFVYFPNSQNVYQYNGRGYKNMGNHLCRYQKK